MQFHYLTADGMDCYKVSFCLRVDGVPASCLMVNRTGASPTTGRTGGSYTAVLATTPILTVDAHRTRISWTMSLREGQGYQEDRWIQQR